MGKVKFYSWGTGKTTAAKQNSNLVDCEDIMNQATPKDKALQIVEQWKNNPENDNKTLLVSTMSLIGLDIYDNMPMAPSREEFIRRMMASHNMYKVLSESLYDYLLEKCPNIQINDTYVSEIEGNETYTSVY